jgi:lipase chaperone LimK
VVDPTSLINQLLRATNAKALDLAELLLARRAELQANRIDYQAASSEALDRPEIRNSLIKLAWENTPDGRRWALGQLLGPDSTRQLAEADNQRLKQAELLKPVIAALGGKVVTIANISGSSHDRGLQVTQRELRRLSTQVDPLAWGPESPVRKRLDEIRQHLAPLKDTVAEPYRPVLASIDSYLVKLTELNEFAYELASVYDVTVVKQLPGAQRAMQLRQLDTWDFRYTAGNLEKFHRTVSAYQELLKTLDELRATLPL